MEISSKIIEEICEGGMEYLFLASLISSDNILTVEDAENGLKNIEKSEKAVKDANIPNKKKEEFNTFFEKARNILKGDIKRFKKKKK